MVDSCSILSRRQFMREKGFEYDPTTTGSSVRFDPPNPNDVVSAKLSFCGPRLRMCVAVHHLPQAYVVASLFHASLKFHSVLAHPDPTIHPAMLREFVKKLKKNYDWIETDALET
jgi:hypothetical protein